MSDTITREVVIKVKTVADQGNAAAMAGVRRQIEQATQIGSGATAPGMAGGRRNPFGGRQTTSANPWNTVNQPVRATQTGNAWDAFSRHGTSAAEAARVNRLAEAEQRRQALEQQRNASRMQSLSLQRSGQLRSAGMNMLGAGGGALGLLKNISLMSATSEKDLERLTRKWIALTAAFEGGRDAITVIVGITKALDALKKAQIAGAAMQALGGAAAGAAGAAGQAAGGAAGSAVAGVAGGATAAAAGKMGLLSRAAKYAPRAGALGGIATGVALAGLAAYDLSTGAHGLDHMMGWSQAKSDKLDEDLQRRNALRAAQKQQLLNEAGPASQYRASRMGMAGERDALYGSGVAAQRREALSQVGAAQQAMAAAQANTGETGIAQRAVASQQELQARRALLDVRKQELAATQQQLAAAKQATTEAKNQVAAARERVAAIKASFGNEQATLGRLSKGEQSRAVSILQKYRDTRTLGKAERRFLDDRGLGGEITQNLYQREGEAAGLTSDLAGATYGRGLFGAERDLKKAHGSLSQAEKGVRDLEAQERKQKSAVGKELDANARAEGNAAQAAAALQGINLGPLVEDAKALDGQFKDLRATINGLTQGAAKANDDLGRKVQDMGKAVTDEIARIAANAKAIADQQNQQNAGRQAQNR